MELRRLAGTVIGVGRVLGNLTRARCSESTTPAAVARTGRRGAGGQGVIGTVSSRTIFQPSQAS